MKMHRKKHDLLARHSRGKNKTGRAFAMAYLRGGYNGSAFTKTVIDATMCAIIATIHS